MISTPDRQKIVTLINTARRNGARLAAACKVVQIDPRIYQRWTRGGRVLADKRPLIKRAAPANKLNPEERQRVLDICHEPTYASMAPGQIVPRLADKGYYLASESSFYRILYEADEHNIIVVGIQNPGTISCLRAIVRQVPTWCGVGI